MVKMTRKKTRKIYIVKIKRQLERILTAMKPKKRSKRRVRRGMATGRRIRREGARKKGRVRKKYMFILDRGSSHHPHITQRQQSNIMD